MIKLLECSIVCPPPPTHTLTNIHMLRNLVILDANRAKSDWRKPCCSKCTYCITLNKNFLRHCSCTLHLLKLRTQNTFCWYPYWLTTHYSDKYFVRESIIYVLHISAQLHSSYLRSQIYCYPWCELFCSLFNPEYGHFDLEIIKGNL